MCKWYFLWNRWINNFRECLCKLIRRPNYCIVKTFIAIFPLSLCVLKLFYILWTSRYLFRDQSRKTIIKTKKYHNNKFLCQTRKIENYRILRGQIILDSYNAFMENESAVDRWIPLFFFTLLSFLLYTRNFWNFGKFL